MRRSPAAEPPHSSQPQRLLRVLGVGFGVAAVIGGTIGFGILRTPGLVAARLPHPSWIIGIWLLGGAYALLDANCTTELTTLVPQAGGPYVFVRAAYGDFPGFVVGVGDWLQNTVALALVAVSMAEYVGGILRPLAGMIAPIAAVVLGVLTAVQLFGVRAGSVMQQWTSAAKTLAFTALIGTLLLADSAAREAPHTLPAGASASSAWSVLLGVVAAFRAVVTTYGGWNSAVYFSEEDEDPGRNLPRALLGGVLLVSAIYVLTNVALLHVLSPAQIAASTLPVATAAQSVFGSATARVITVLALVSLLSILNATVLLTPRVLYGLGRDGLLPSAVSRVTRSGTPVTATLLTGGIAVVLALLGTFDMLLAAYALIGVLNAVVVNASLFTLRRRWPERVRPFRAVGYPGTVVAVLIINAMLAAGFVIDDPTSGAYLLVVLAASYPVYRLAKRRSATGVATPTV